MTTKLYKAREMYKKDMNVMSSYRDKLHKSGNNYYLYNKKTNGEWYKQNVKPNDLVYNRTETGITKYDEEQDKDIPAITKDKASYKEHIPYMHMTDRKSKSSGRVFRK